MPAALRGLLGAGLGGSAGQRFRLALQLLQLPSHRRVAGQPERMRAGQQPVQHHAQLPEVGGGGDRRVVQLFRRGVFEGQRAVVGGGGVGAFELLGDAEIEQLDPAVAIDQQVGGLEVAMDHQVAMGETHRVQHLQEQHHALAQAEPARIAPAVDGFAIDAFHHEVRFAIGADAAIEQGGDVGVLQAGQDLPFAQEAFARGGRIGAGSDQFQCRLLGVGTVAALDRVYRAHATAADHLAHAPGTDAASEHGVGCATRRLRLQCLAPGRDVAAERLAGAGVGVEQRLHLLAQCLVAVAQGIDLLQARLAGEVGDDVEDRQRAPPAFGRGVAHVPSSASRNARARRQSRRRVRSLMPSIAAISVSE